MRFSILISVYYKFYFVNKCIDRVTLEFVNQYWPFMTRELLPETKKRIEPLLIAEANKFLNHVPLRKMLYYGEDAA